MPTFLTVREAAKRTGKSASSIRRILYPITNDDGHPDREQVQPSVDEARQRRLNAENFAWRISEELLQRALRFDPKAEKTAAGAPAHDATGTAGLLAMLQHELQIKNQQIADLSEQNKRQTELMSALSERMRESNMLIGGLQQRLALTEGHSSKPAGPVEVKPGRTAPAEKATKPAPKPAKRKRGPLSWLFGSAS